MHTISKQMDHLAVYLLNHGANPLIKNNSGDVARDLAAGNSFLLDLIKEKERLFELEKVSKETKHSELLLDAVQKFDVRAKKIDELLSLGADINYQDASGFSPLMYALDAQNERIAEYLLNCGANPLLKNRNGNTARYLASRNSGIYQVIMGYELITYASRGSLSGIKSLVDVDNSIIDFQGPDGYTPLLIAAQLGLAEIVQYLLLQGANQAITLSDGRGILELTTNKAIKHLLDFSDTPGLNDMSDDSKKNSTKAGFFESSTSSQPSYVGQ